jgi:hypothetical protein
MKNRIDHESLLAEAMQVLRTGPDGAALVALTRLMAFSPGFGPGYLAWGDRVSRKGGGGNGLSLLRKALIAGPQDARVYQRLSDLEYRRREIEKAGWYARACLLLTPGNSGAFRVLSSAAFHRKDHDLAVRLLASARCISSPKGPDLLILMWALFELDRLAECVQVARWFLLVSPGNADGYTLFARVLARQDELVPAAIQVGRLERLKPGDPDVLLAKGRVARARRWYNGACRSFRRALLTEPSRGEGMFDLARSLWGAEANLEAERVLKRVCRVNPWFERRAAVLRQSATQRDFRLPESKK